MIVFLVLVTIALGLFIYDMVKQEIREWSVISGPRISALIQWLRETIGPRVSVWIGGIRTGWTQGRQEWEELRTTATTRAREWVEPRVENVRNQWQRVGGRFFGAPDEEEPHDEPSPEREAHETGGTLGERTGYSTPVRRRGPLSSPQV